MPLLSTWGRPSTGALSTSQWPCSQRMILPIWKEDFWVLPPCILEFQLACFCASKCICCEPVSAITMSCPGDSISQHFFPPSFSCAFSFLFWDGPRVIEGRRWYFIKMSQFLFSPLWTLTSPCNDCCPVQSFSGWGWEQPVSMGINI